MSLIYDFENSLAEAVSEENGVSRKELEEIRPRCEEALSSIIRQHQAGSMGFMDLTAADRSLEDIEVFAGERTGRFDDLLVLGIGGSSLGCRAVRDALLHPFYNLLDGENRRNRPRLWILENVDPETVNAVLEMIQPEKTLVNIITKSGGTAETVANYLALLERLTPAETVMTTTKRKGDMDALARAGNHASFFIPDNVGGRFSVLSPVGLLPAAFCGIYVRELRAGADYMREICLNDDVDENPALISAAIQYLLDTRKGKTIQVIFPYADSLSSLGAWFCQLWAESLGKKYDRNGELVQVGQTPVCAIGTTDQHSQIQLYNHGPNDKSILFLEPLRYRVSLRLSEALSTYASASYLSGKTLNELIRAEKQGTEQALTVSKRPNSTIHIPEINAFTLGQLFFLFEFQTAVAGELYNINAFDQPGVEDGKKITARLMGKKE